ncbi:VCBS repeat-containing protein [Zobellia sp. B3R18]|uniref:VCBS repeat-containing protein n=1 Tax=Zobellia sp. B3R18 TaxID=2841568 RepID=UPI001C065EEB|nr:VCBS repeat-containing protein [Zobellia sp. B3R18]MBU2974699.1 VCBS repeat-containing protein [Zobellia sp. B3R18]
MTKSLFTYFRWSYLTALFLIISCTKETKTSQTKTEQQSNPLFTLLSAEETNIHFQNELKESLNANVLVYEYLYNGGGVATGDFNGDNLIDIYFTSNMGANEFYINQGSMTFLNATKTAKVGGRPGPWKTGVSAADVNGDGKLDLYICYSGALPPHKRKNQLFINQGNNDDGIPIFSEQAEQYGLDSEAFSNQGFFFDYDHDNDLDMLLLNHNPKSLPVLNEQSSKVLLEKDDPLQGIRLYKQTNGKFVDITAKSGVSGSALTYGLGLGISDLNNDGWPDFYVSNDYTIPDYLYLNNKNGTFTNSIKDQMGHTSHFSMGNDIADINNDGWPDIFTLDMLPESNKRQKLLLAPDNYEKFDLNIRSGFHYQYMRNMLQINNGNNTYSEIGQLAGLSNTDWSWAALFADYDNDGYKDLYVTNGYFKDYTNLDFINYMEDYVKSKGRLKREDVLEIIQQMPSSNLSNYYFSNIKGKTFNNETIDNGMGQPSNSNGAAYADLDNDGDLDLIVNNINKPAFIYRNEANKTQSNYLKIQLKGEGLNTQGIGAKISLYTNGSQQTIEQMPTRGYLSTVSPILHFGLGSTAKIDSLKIKWNTGKSQTILNAMANQTIIANERNAEYITEKSKSQKTIFKKVDETIKFVHQASSINDFKRQSLLISQLSHTGPSMASEDINHDGLKDLVIGGSKGQGTTLYLQQENNQFIHQPVIAFEDDKNSHDTDISIFDANGDNHPDIYVASGGYHNYDQNDTLLRDRLYLGDGKGGFKRNSALPQFVSSTGCIAIADVNGDNYPDVFGGGSVTPGRYPETTKNYLLINDGKGNFTNEIKSLAPEAEHLGMVTDAKWLDINNDNKNDLVIVGKWMPLSVFVNVDGKLKNKTSSLINAPLQGLWNTVEIGDFNSDGKPDMITGNMGTNTQFSVSTEQPAELYFKDFDKNGSVDPLFTFYIQDISYPYLTRDELLGQLPGKRNQFNSYKNYADATIDTIFSSDDLKDAKKLTANEMKTTALLSNTDGTYDLADLPIEAQYAPIHAIQINDFNADGNQDLLLFGNHHHYKLRLGKFDANYGSLFFGDGKGNFNYVTQMESGLSTKGSVQSALWNNDLLYLGIYGEQIQTYQLNK